MWQVSGLFSVPSLLDLDFLELPRGSSYVSGCAEMLCGGNALAQGISYPVETHGILLACADSIGSALVSGFGKELVLVNSIQIRIPR